MEISTPVKFLRAKKQNGNAPRVRRPSRKRQADLERQAVEAIGKNFVKASAESVNEALEKMGTASKEKNAQAASGGQPAGEGKRADEAELSREALRYGKKRRDRGQSAETAGREYAQGMGDS